MSPISETADRIFWNLVISEQRRKLQKIQK